jgi:cohesin loading factor subunit SCC2
VSTSYVFGRWLYASALSRQYQEYHNHIQYPPYHSYPSCPSNAFVFTQNAPSFSYPTPPAPGIHSSSSSLAFALDERAIPQKMQHDFLDKSSRRLERAQAAKYTIPRYSSPDPLELPLSQSVTPQKRKSLELLQSPSAKRAPTLHRTPSLSGPPTTPASSSQGSLSTQGTPVSSQSTPPSRPVPSYKPKMRAYVEIPFAPKFLSTQQPPQSGKKVVRPTVVSRGSKDREEIDEEDDLGGFGPEEDSPHRPRKTSLSMTEGRSFAKRTGDRDDRGNTSLTCCRPT